MLRRPSGSLHLGDTDGDRVDAGRDGADRRAAPIESWEPAHVPFSIEYR
jgi:hypothetical protein